MSVVRHAMAGYLGMADCCRAKRFDRVDVQLLTVSFLRSSTLDGSCCIANILT